MKNPILYISIAIGAITSTCAIADGGISAGGEIAEFLVITVIGWILSSIYIGIVLKIVTGGKRYITASPFIPWLFITLMLFFAVLIAQAVGNLFRINSSLVESSGLYLSLAMHVLVCAIIFWKSRSKLVRKLMSLITLPVVVLSFIWIKAYVFG